MLGHDVALFVALLATAIALGGAFVGVFALPNILGLSGEYYTAQKTIHGWSQLGYILPVQLAAMITVVVMSREEPFVRGLAAAGILCLVFGQALFWVYAYPASAATENWTKMPADLNALRRQWEFAHAAGAVFQLLVMACLTVTALTRLGVGSNPAQMNRDNQKL